MPTPQQITPLAQRMAGCNAVTLDFLERCLDKDPGRRWTCEQLLRHAYFENFSFKMDGGDDVQSFEKITRDKSRVGFNGAIDFLGFLIAFFVEFDEYHVVAAVAESGKSNKTVSTAIKG